MGSAFKADPEVTQAAFDDGSCAGRVGHARPVQHLPLPFHPAEAEDADDIVELVEPGSQQGRTDMDYIAGRPVRPDEPREIVPHFGACIHQSNAKPAQTRPQSGRCTNPQAAVGCTMKDVKGVKISRL